MKPALQLRKIGAINNRPFLSDRFYKIIVDGYTPLVYTYYKVYHKVVSKIEISLYDILKDVSNKSGIPIAVLKGEMLWEGKKRKREVVEARQFYFKRARDKTKHSLARIGLLVGKDHATVLHGIKTVNNALLREYEIFFGNKISDKPRPEKYTREIIIKLRQESTESIEKIKPAEKIFQPEICKIGGDIITFHRPMIDGYHAPIQ